jgi:hypothetical protein
MKSIYYFLFAALTLVSCETIIPFEDKDTQSLITMNAALNEGDSIVAHLSRSVSILDNGSPQILDSATVLMRMNGGSWDTLTHMFKGFYTPMASSGNLFAQADGFYEFEAYHTGLDSVSGHATVPMKPVVLSVDSINSGVIPRGGWSYPYREFTLVMSDSGQAGYCRIEAYQRFRGTAIIPPYPLQVSSDDILVSAGGGRKPFTYSLLFSNESFLNTNRSIDVSVYGVDPNSGMEIVFKLTKMDLSSYLYDVTFENYQNNSGPFTQPVTVYSNVENGLGVVSAKSSIWAF